MDAEIAKEILWRVIIPVGLGVLGYFCTLGWATMLDRKNQSKLGVAILDALAEELQNGIRIMGDLLKAAESKDYNTVSLAKLPRASWAGMTTIPDSVLLRILAMADKLPVEGFNVRNIRIHCKNYFEHVCVNYDQLIAKKIPDAKRLQDNTWCDLINKWLANEDEEKNHLKSAKNVLAMVKNARNALEKNSKKWLLAK